MTCSILGTHRMLITVVSGEGTYSVKNQNIFLNRIRFFRLHSASFIFKALEQELKMS